MTEKKQGAAEWLREKAQRVRRSKGFGCKELMESEFGESCDGRRCADCHADLFERVADRIDAEQALPEGVEWPRFEDGEPVRFGDEVEFEGEVGKVVCVRFELLGWSMTLNRNLDLSYLSGAYGERLKRPTPKVLDADGAPIEVGDTVYCDGEDEPLRVVGSHAGTREVTLTTAKDSNFAYYTVAPSRLSHKRPDSWRSWGEDLEAAAKAGEVDKVEMMRRAKALAKTGE